MPGWFRLLRAILGRLRAFQQTIEREEQEMVRSAARSGRAFAKRIDRLAQQVEDEVQQFLKGPFRQIYTEGAQRSDDRPLTAGQRVALRNLENDTFADIAAATRAMRDDTKRLIRDVAKEAVRRQAEEGKGISQLRIDMADELKRNGFVRERPSQFKQARRQGFPGLRFVDKGGRHWRLDSYCEMVIRTKSAQAHNAGTILKGVEAGFERFRVIDGIRSDDICKRANGKVVSAEWALAHPVAHPNCTRTFSGVS